MNPQRRRLGAAMVISLVGGPLPASAHYRGKRDSFDVLLVLRDGDAISHQSYRRSAGCAHLNPPQRKST